MRHRVFAILAAAAIICCLLAIGATLTSWILGQGIDPLEIWRERIVYDLDNGGRMFGTHLGTHNGWSFFFWAEIDLPRHQQALVKLSRGPQWRYGDASRSSETELLFLTAPYPRSTLWRYLEPNWHYLGFNALQYRASFTHGFVFVVPDWFLVLLFAIPPTRWVVRRIRSKRRSAAQQCRSCGYDLRATPERCPECGAVPSGAKL